MSSPTYRKLRRARLLERSRKGVLARERKRMENPPPDYTKWERYYPLQFGVRNKATGETCFVDLKSVRHAAKAIGLLLKYYL